MTVMCVHVHAKKHKMCTCTCIYINKEGHIHVYVYVQTREHVEEREIEGVREREREGEVFVCVKEYQADQVHCPRCRHHLLLLLDLLSLVCSSPVLSLNSPPLVS